MNCQSLNPCFTMNMLYYLILTKSSCHVRLKSQQCQPPRFLLIPCSPPVAPPNPATRPDDAKCLRNLLEAFEEDAIYIYIYVIYIIDVNVYISGRGNIDWKTDEFLKASKRSQYISIYLNGAFFNVNMVGWDRQLTQLVSTMIMDDLDLEDPEN